jgi:signal transduction histidine kinase
MAPKQRDPDRIDALRGLRWPLAAAAGLVFALARLAEARLLGAQADQAMARTLDPLFWGLLAALAIFGVLSWAARQEQLRRSAETIMLGELRRTNHRLEQLYEINQRIASSDTIDDVLDYAITLPDRLLGTVGAALVLGDERGAMHTLRCAGLCDDDLQAARAAFGLLPRPGDLSGPRLIRALSSPPAPLVVCALIPLAEAHDAPLGWFEAYLKDEPDAAGWEELAPLLRTLGGELAEAVQGSRRRTREIASVVALEQAITVERTRIARDLHDGVAQSLAFMRMRVDLWEDWLDQEPGRLREEFSALKSNLRTQIEELRRAIFELRPLELSQLGFAGALRRFVSEFAEQQAWDLDLDLAELPPDLPHVLELAAFRFVQEALNNAAKHARARRVGVALRGSDSGLLISVRDDGVGFDPGAQAADPAGRLGLRQMRERAAALDGSATILARPGAGTEVRVWLPFAYTRP